MNEILEPFLVSMSANFVTDGIKKIWSPIRRRLLDRGMSVDPIEKFEANDPDGRAAVQQALERLLQADIEYWKEIKKADSQMREIINRSMNGGVHQEAKKIKKSAVLQIAGNSNQLPGTIPPPKP